LLHRPASAVPLEESCLVSAGSPVDALDRQPGVAGIDCPLAVLAGRPVSFVPYTTTLRPRRPRGRPSVWRRRAADPVGGEPLAPVNHRYNENSSPPPYFRSRGRSGARRPVALDEVRSTPRLPVLRSSLLGTACAAGYCDGCARGPRNRGGWASDAPRDRGGTVATRRSVRRAPPWGITDLPSQASLFYFFCLVLGGSFSLFPSLLLFLTRASTICWFSLFSYCMIPVVSRSRAVPYATKPSILYLRKTAQPATPPHLFDCCVSGGYTSPSLCPTAFCR